MSSQLTCFARGKLQDTLTTVHSAVVTVNGSLWLNNTDAAPQTVQINTNRVLGGGSMVEATITLPAGYKARISDIILSIGDSLEVLASTADVVNFELTGTANIP